jgi:hypothetical protein
MNARLVFLYVSHKDLKTNVVVTDELETAYTAALMASMLAQRKVGRGEQFYERRCQTSFAILSRTAYPTNRY